MDFSISGVQDTEASAGEEDQFRKVFSPFDFEVPASAIKGKFTKQLAISISDLLHFGNHNVPPFRGQLIGLSPL